MAPRMALCALGALFTIPSVFAHMQMLIPSPLRDPHSDRDDEPKDWNILTPLRSDGSDFACKGYQWTTPWTPVARYEVGGTYQMTLKGGATHGGGSCQISMSCDGGSEFKAIKSIVGGCPIKKKYDFTIPRELESALGKERKATCLLGWTWFNRIGNREMYMNCAVVDIVPHGSLQKDKSKKKKEKESKSDKRDVAMVNAAAQTALSGYPDLFVANLAKINDCATKETFEVIFNDPGFDVVYGDDENKSSSKTTFKGRACTGRSRKSAGSSTSTSESSPKEHSKPSGNNGQWQGGNDNREQETSSDSSDSSKISDGQWHPELWGSPSSKSDEKDDDLDRNQKQKSDDSSSEKSNEKMKDHEPQEADDSNFEPVDVKHPEKKPNTAVEKELDAYLSNLYDGRQRERKSCEQLPIESNTELSQRDKESKTSDSEAIKVRENQNENFDSQPRASRQQRWANYKRSSTTHDSNSRRSLDFPSDAMSPIPGTLNNINIASDDKFLAFIDRLNHAGGNLFTLVKFASTYLDHAPPADIGFTLTPGVEGTDSAALAYNKGLLEAQEARNKINKISTVVQKKPFTGMTAEIAKQIVNQLSVPAALPVIAPILAVAPVKAPGIVPEDVPAAGVLSEVLPVKAPVAESLEETPKNLPSEKAPVLQPKAKPEVPTDILTELLKRNTMDSANHEADDQFWDLLARLQNLEDEVDDLLDYVGAGESRRRSLQDQNYLSSPQAPASAVSTITGALEKIGQQMERLISIAGMSAGAVVKSDPSVKRSTTNYIESTFKDSELKIWHRIIHSLHPETQKRQLLVPGLFPAQLQTDKKLQIALCTLKHFSDELGVKLPDIKDLFGYQEPRAHWSRKPSSRDTASSVDISCANVLQKRQSWPFVAGDEPIGSSDGEGEGGPSQGAAEMLFPSGEPDALMEGVETPETQPGFDWSELFPHLQEADAEASNDESLEDPRPLRGPPEDDGPLPRPILSDPRIQSLPPPDGPILPPSDLIDSDDGPIANLGPIGTPDEETAPRVLVEPTQPGNLSRPFALNTTTVNVFEVTGPPPLTTGVPLVQSSPEEAVQEDVIPVIPVSQSFEQPVEGATAADAVPEVAAPVPVAMSDAEEVESVDPVPPSVEAPITTLAEPPVVAQAPAPVLPVPNVEEPVEAITAAGAPPTVPEILEPVDSEVQIDSAIVPAVGPLVKAGPLEVVPAAVAPQPVLSEEDVPEDVIAPAVLSAQGIPPIAPAPEVDPTEAPEVDPAVAPEVDLAVAPEVLPEVAPEAISAAAPEVLPAVAPDASPAVAPEAIPEIAPAVAPESISAAAPEAIPAAPPGPVAPLPAEASTGQSLGDLMKEAFPELAAQQEQHTQPGEWTDGAIHRPANLPVRSTEKPPPKPKVDPAEDVAAILPFFMGPGPVVPPGMTINWPTPTGPVDNLEKMPPLVNDLGPNAEEEILKFFADLKKDASSPNPSEVESSSSKVNTLSSRQIDDPNALMHTTTDTDLQARCHLKKKSVQARIESWEREVNAQCARTRAGIGRLAPEGREKALQACLERQTALKERVARLIAQFSQVCGAFL